MGTPVEWKKGDPESWIVQECLECGWNLYQDEDLPDTLATCENPSCDGHHVVIFV